MDGRSSRAARQDAATFWSNPRSGPARGLTDYAASSTNDEAALDAEFGNTAGARKSAELALRLAPDSFDSQTGAAMAFAMIGDLSRAEALAKYAAAKSPTNLLLNNVSLATIRAAIEMHRGNFSG